MLETKDLILRKWREEDARDLYEYAKDPRVGPSAGWPVHTSVENSLEIIKTVFSRENIFAVVLKETNKAIGSIGLHNSESSNLGISQKEGELGYWIGVPYWGRGLIPQAAKEIIRYGFEDLGLNAIWCGYFDGNEKSRRVQEKCGFVYHHTNENIPWKSMDDIRTEHVSILTKEKWKTH